MGSKQPIRMFIKLFYILKINLHIYLMQFGNGNKHVFIQSELYYKQLKEISYKYYFIHLWIELRLH